PAVRSSRSRRSPPWSTRRTGRACPSPAMRWADRTRWPLCAPAWDTIEHGAWLDEETVAEMARRGTWYVPTFAIYRWHAERGTAFRQARARELIMPHRESFARARAAGVRIALGTDSGGYGHGETAVELAHMVEAGSSPAEAVAAGTARAAECLGLGAETGALE